MRAPAALPRARVHTQDAETLDGDQPASIARPDSFHRMHLAFDKFLRARAILIPSLC